MTPSLLQIDPPCLAPMLSTKQEFGRSFSPQNAAAAECSCSSVVAPRMTLFATSARPPAHEPHVCTLLETLRARTVIVVRKEKDKAALALYVGRVRRERVKRVNETMLPRTGPTYACRESPAR